MTIDGRTERARALETALSSEERRQIVRYFRDATEQVISLDVLVAELFDAERSPEDRERLAVRLHHVALPKLAEAGFIEYDARSRTVRYRETRRAGQVSNALDEWEVAE